MTTAAAALTRDEVAQILDELRSPLVRAAAAQPENRHFTTDSLSDVYSKATVILLGKDPFPIFEHRAQVYEFMRRTLQNVIRDEHKWHARHPEAQLIDEADLGVTAGDGGSETYGTVRRELIDYDDPAAATQLHDHADKVSEWATTVSDADMPVALLKFHPSSFATTKDIAKRLGMPLEDCQDAVRRLVKNFNKYMAEANEVNICEAQRATAQAWLLNGGRMPLGLKIHTRRCQSCHTALVAIRHQQTDAYKALLPLAGAAIPAGGGLTLLGRLAPRHSAQKVRTAITNLRSVGGAAGKGGAAIAGKAAATPAVVAALAVGTVSAGAFVAHAVTSSPPTSVVHTTKPGTKAALVVTSPPASRVTSTTPRKAHRHRKHAPHTTASTAVTTTAASTTAASTTAASTTAASSTAATTRSSTVASSTTQTPGGALPNPQQASQAP